ncbi:hypothetical protein FDECE_18039 [Fusarium decemcellulare]|nr:hypothetical protein FDECE_18039 [Fusarium decemcellulare]
MRFHTLVLVAIGVAASAQGAITGGEEPTSSAKLVKKQSCPADSWCGGAQGGCPAYVGIGTVLEKMLIRSSSAGKLISQEAVATRIVFVIVAEARWNSCQGTGRSSGTWYSKYDIGTRSKALEACV